MSFKGLLLSGVVGLFALNAGATTEITIYNQDLAMVKKDKEVELNFGVNDIYFDEIATTTKPESVIIYGKDFNVIEQNFLNNTVNYRNMLKANIGKNVKTMRVNPISGRDEFSNAEILAVDGDNPVLKFDYGIETKFSGQVVFDDVPDGLNNSPVLNARIDADKKGKETIGLAYLANGFSWNANYVAKVKDDKNLEVLGRVVLYNNSGSDYKDVGINLVAGEVNTVREVMPRMMKTMMTRSMALDMASNSVIKEPESLGGFYLYKLPFETTLNDGENKMVSFLDAKKVSYIRENIFNSTLAFGVNKNSFKDEHPLMIYRFKNTQNDGLGVPLPEGKISFYDTDKDGELQFVGEDRINNIAKEQEVVLNMGKNFDVFAKGEIVDMHKVGERKYKKNPNDRCITVENMYIYEVEYEVTNSSKYASEVVLKQPFYNGATIIKESIKGELTAGDIYQWKLNIDAGETKTITATVKSHLDIKDCM